MENNTDIEHQNESITNNNIVANIVANADSNDKKSTDNIRCISRLFHLKCQKSSTHYLPTIC